MNKTLQVIFGILVVGLLAFIALGPKENGGVINFGGDATSEYSDATNSSSTVPTTATTTSPILSLNTYRRNATVCYLSGTSTIFLHQKGQATTTGVVLNEGIPLATSTANSFPTCRDFPGFIGYLFSISNSNAVVSVSYHQ